MVQLEETAYQELIQTRQQLAQAQQEQAEKITLLEAEVAWYREQLGLAKKRLYAPSSEKSAPGQEEMLFNEAEACASPQLPDPQTEVVTYKRRKTTGKREAQLADLPTLEIDYELTEEERVCPECAGPLHKMGVDTRQEIKIIPAQVILVKHNRGKYACRDCNRNAINTPILSAPMPKSAFPNSLASPSSVAYLMSQKFVEGLPLYRQEQALLRLGFELSRQTMANWMLAGADWLEQITRRMKTKLLERDLLHADETPLQVLKEEGRKAQTTSFMWLYRSGRDGPPIVLYDYQQTRATEHPSRFLEGFSGYLHVDGYQVYEKLPGVTLVGCLAHARRNFVDALSVLSPMAQKKGGTAAHQGLEYCDKLFAIERDLTEVTPEERFAGRLARSQPVLAEFHAWLAEKAITVLPKSTTGQAIGYCLNQWTKLTAFLADGRLEISNNRAERAIKPFVIGRKNWLFADTPRGAEASATIYSLVETAKENNLNPLAYMTYLFERLPNINWKDPQALDLLLPWAQNIQEKFRVKSRANQ
jgi:transposase